MEINKEELVNSVDTELLDSQIDQITDSFVEEHFLDNDEAEQLEMLVAKSMKLGELYERKKWQEKATPDGFVLVPKESLKVALYWMDENIDAYHVPNCAFAELFEHKPILENALEAQEQSHD